MNTYLTQYAGADGSPAGEPRRVNAFDVEGAVRRFLVDHGVSSTPTHVPAVGVWQATRPDGGTVFVRAVRMNRQGWGPLRP